MFLLIFIVCVFFFVNITIMNYIQGVWICCFLVCGPVTFIGYATLLKYVPAQWRSRPFQSSAPPISQPSQQEIEKRVIEYVCYVFSTCAALLALYLCPGAPAASGPVWSICQLVLLALQAEFFFYGMHRLLHSVYLYRSVHSVHHSVRAPTAFAALYAHPVELLLGNFLPLGLPLIILRPDLLVCCIWLMLATTGTCNEHAGFAVLWWPGKRAAAHDIHHEIGHGNYSFLGVADFVFGTAMPEHKAVKLK